MRSKISFKHLGWMLLIAPFLRANGLSVLWPISWRIYDVFELLSVFIVVLLYINHLGKRKRIDWPVILTALLFVLIFIPTLAYHGNYMNHIRLAASSLGLVMTVSILSDKAGVLIAVLTADLDILILANAFSMVLFPNGIYVSSDTAKSTTNWIMGLDNHWFVFYYMAYYLAVISIIYYKNRVGGFFRIIVLHLTAFYTRSGVLVFGLLLFDLVMFFKIYRWRKFTVKNILFVSIGTSLIFIFLSQLSIVQYFIKNIYGRTGSFTGRLKIWGKSFGLIKNHLILGNGMRTLDQNRLYYGFFSAGNAHNHWLEMLVEGGIIGFSLFILLILICEKSNKSIGKKDLFSRISLVPLFVMFMAMSMDSMQEIRGVLLYCMLSIAYYSEVIGASLYEVCSANLSAERFPVGKRTKRIFYI